MARVSAVGGFLIAVEFSSSTGVSNVPSALLFLASPLWLASLDCCLPCCCWRTCSLKFLLLLRILLLLSRCAEV